MRELTGPHPDTIRHLRETAGLSADATATLLTKHGCRITQQHWSRIEAGYRPPTAEEWMILGPSFALGSPGPKEFQPNYFVARANSGEPNKFTGMLDAEKRLGIFREGMLAHTCAQTIGAFGIPGVFACPAWDDFMAVVIKDYTGGPEDFFIVDEDIGGRYSEGKRQFSKRVRSAEHAANVMRKFLADLTARELTTLARAA